KADQTPTPDGKSRGGESSSSPILSLSVVARPPIRPLRSPAPPGTEPAGRCCSMSQTPRVRLRPTAANAAAGGQLRLRPPASPASFAFCSPRSGTMTRPDVMAGPAIFPTHLSHDDGNGDLGGGQLAFAPSGRVSGGIDAIVSGTTFVLGIGVGALVFLAVVASRLYFMIRRQGRSDPSTQSPSGEISQNRSVGGGGSRTAILALWGRSQAYRMGLPGASDRLAPELMKRLSLFGDRGRGSDDPEFEFGRALSSVCADLSVFNHRITGRGDIFEDRIARLVTLGATGLVAPLHLRTWWLDEVVGQFVDELCFNDNAADQVSPHSNVVILGSGYDTRAYRLESLRCSNTNVFEVDAVGTQSQKKRLIADIVQSTGSNTMQPIFVPCDFEAEDWLDCLLRHGFDQSLPTLVLWEGVTMYLSLSTIRSTLSVIANKGCSKVKHEDPNAPWYIAFDYLSLKLSTSPLLKFPLKFGKEPFRSAFTKCDMEQTLATSGLHAIDHLDGSDIDRRFAAQSSTKNKNDLSNIKMGDYGGFVLARKS
ncbi:hypothetical protein ACHAWF_014691, partial [Thalassiosira exigua]